MGARSRVKLAGLPARVVLDEVGRGFARVLPVWAWLLCAAMALLLVGFCAGIFALVHAVEPGGAGGGEPGMVIPRRQPSPPPDQPMNPVQPAEVPVDYPIDYPVDYSALYSAHAFHSLLPWPSVLASATVHS